MNPRMEALVARCGWLTRRIPYKRRIGLATAALALRHQRLDFVFDCEALDIAWSARAFPDKLTRHLLFEGLYQEDVLEMLRGSLRPGDLVVDVGAHHGLMSIIAAKRVGPHGRVIAFEPNPEARVFLLENLRVNGLDNVTVEACGMLDREGELAFYRQHGDRSWNSSFVRDFVAEHQRAEPIAVPVSTIDRYGATHGVVPAFLKIDIEGCEIMALAGARRTLEDHQPVLALELNRISAERAGTSIEAIVALLENLGYELRVLPRDVLGRYRFERQESFAIDRHVDAREVANVLCIPRARRELVRGPGR